MKNQVTLHSLNIQVEDLIPLIYHQTGRQYRWEYAAVNPKKLEDFAKKFFSEIQDITFNIENIYEKEENYKGNMFQKREEVKNISEKQVYNMIGIIAKWSLKFTYIPKIIELKKLYREKPNLYKWFKPHVINTNTNDENKKSS